jgi:enamine deaminase RidA (YjgF/YER057c/UK114 family)
MQIDMVQPRGLEAAARLFQRRLVTGAGRLLFVAGQIAWDAEQQLVGRGDFVAQFRQALANVAAVVAAAGGKPEHLVRLTLYVKDKRAYLAAGKELGAIYRAAPRAATSPPWPWSRVADLLEDGALVEIEATAALPSAVRSSRPPCALDSRPR